MSADVDFDDASLVKSSTVREAVVDDLADGPATPSDIADACTHDISHVSRALREMRDADIVELLVSEERKKGRIYGLTDAGEAVVSFLDERGQSREGDDE
ncbi:winged helix-turn-helix domain-containing protein [Haloarcula laminariae]|uniref:winged helix-turn-helix domain-containing protein n=1 Tax=Haloarcula laminariae TaxID=2961577 RepID=UPI0021CAD278|nr:winged helix-turn-helix domain-containing protein [Halomicroarcula laminariae]